MRSGLKIHANKSHKGCKELYERTMHQFFPLLEERKWVTAERFVSQVEEMELDDEWRRGYTNALRGMTFALRKKTSSVQPYILKVKDYDEGKLQEERKFFKKALKRKFNTGFDRGFFQAWYKYISYLLRKTR